MGDLEWIQFKYNIGWFCIAVAFGVLLFGGIIDVIGLALNLSLPVTSHIAFGQIGVCFIGVLGYFLVRRTLHKDLGIASRA